MTDQPDWRKDFDVLYGKSIWSCVSIIAAGIVIGFALGGSTGRNVAIAFCSFGVLLLAASLVGRRVLRRQMAERDR